MSDPTDATTEQPSDPEQEDARRPDAEGGEGQPEVEEQVEEAADASSTGADRVEGDFEALLADVTRERDEYLDLARRAKADFENYRKRAAREAAEAEQRGKAGLARAVLPSLDNLERAVKAAQAEPAKEGEKNLEALKRGVELVRAELEAALTRAGVEAYEPDGEPFDPKLHEAISTRPAADGESSGAVVETLERGYRLGDQVLRPARVIVAE